MRRMLVLAISVGCGQSSGPNPCAAAKSHLYDILTNDKTVEDTGGAFPAMASRLFDSCTRDRWSREAIDCFTAAPAMVELMPCLDRLSAAQRESLERGWDEVMRTKPAPKKWRSPTEIATMTVERYAFEAYPVWSMKHPDQTCPTRLEDLQSVMPNDAIDAIDPWGHPYEMVCGTSDLRGRLLVLSLGPDGKRDTDDDIKPR